MSPNNILYQPNLVLNIPKVINNQDYANYCALLDRIDELLIVSGVESDFVNGYLTTIVEQKREEKNDPQASLSRWELRRYSSYAIRGLRCNIIGIILGESLRNLSLRIAESPVLQRFCQVGDISQVRAPSKSLLGDYRNAFSTESTKVVFDRLLKMATRGDNVFELKNPLDTQEVYIDCTCLESNIHFPVDWLLLRDGVRTIIKSILVIRKHGLRHRIGKPEDFLRKINKLCIQMSNTRRKKGAKKSRKVILRRMKRLSNIVEAHGHRYVKLLETRFFESDLSEGEAGQIIRRLTNVLDSMPQAREQAHRRIISEKQLKNDEKLLSLYDDAVSVIKRGKSEAEVEFGNELFLAEQKDGLIIDWQLYGDQIPNDTNKIPEFVDRLKESQLDVTDISSDRGFFSKRNETLLRKNKLNSFLCPRDPALLQASMQDETFQNRQRRRSQTEGRMGIVKNNFTQNPIRSRVFEFRQRHVAWAIVAHNLWVLARLPKAEETQQAIPA